MNYFTDAQVLTGTRAKRQKIAHDTQVETNSNTPSWRGQTINKIDPLPEWTHTHLKYLNLQNTSNSLSVKTVWDRAKSSDHMVIIADNKLGKLTRLPIAGTDLAVSDTGFSQGTHIIEIEWPAEMRGTHAVIGIALQGIEPRRCSHYTNLLGSTDASRGWDIQRNRLLHGDQKPENYPKNKLGRTFKTSDKTRLVIDMSVGTVGFETNCQYLGDAFSGLKGKTVYPAISAVWGNAEIKIQYISGEQASTPLSLQALSKLSLRTLLTHESQVSQLPLPSGLRNYLVGKQ